MLYAAMKLYVKYLKCKNNVDAVWKIKLNYIENV